MSMATTTGSASSVGDLGAINWTGVVSQPHQPISLPHSTLHETHNSAMVSR